MPKTEVRVKLACVCKGSSSELSGCSVKVSLLQPFHISILPSILSHLQFLERSLTSAQKISNTVKLQGVTCPPWLQRTTCDQTAPPKSQDLKTSRL